ncbi:hypothetical protein [Symbiopectobacterium sp.]|uniref:hypothetical protein n=1 Tax=Symbiopectobacterium sp. TaxID=2952789 RepID=UPI003F68617D
MRSIQPLFLTFPISQFSDIGWPLVHFEQWLPAREKPKKIVPPSQFQPGKFQVEIDVITFRRAGIAR